MTTQQHHAAARAAFVEDVEWLLDAGEAPSAIAERLGRSLEAIQRRLYRAGRRDLARRLGETRDRRDYKRQYDATRAHPCIDCGGTASRDSKARCRTCENKRRAKAS